MNQEDSLFQELYSLHQYSFKTNKYVFVTNIFFTQKCTPSFPPDVNNALNMYHITCSFVEVAENVIVIYFCRRAD